MNISWVIAMAFPVVAGLVLMYRESPQCERRQQIKRLVNESERKKLARARKPKRGYGFAQAGWRE